MLTEEDKQGLTTLLRLVRWSDIQKTEHCQLLLAALERTNERFPGLPVRKVFICPMIPVEETGGLMIKVAKSEVALMRGRLKEDPVNQIFRAIDYRDPTEEDFDFLEVVYPDLLAQLKTNLTHWLDIFGMWEKGETFSSYC